MSWWPKRFIWLNSRRRLGVGAVFGVSFSTMARNPETFNAERDAQGTYRHAQKARGAAA